VFLKPQSSDVSLPDLVFKMKISVVCTLIFEMAFIFSSCLPSVCSLSIVSYASGRIRDFGNRKINKHAMNIDTSHNL
jgi:hypothetical protein